MIEMPGQRQNPSLAAIARGLIRVFEVWDRAGIAHALFLYA